MGSGGKHAAGPWGLEGFVSKGTSLLAVHDHTGIGLKGVPLSVFFFLYIYKIIFLLPFKRHYPIPLPNGFLLLFSFGWAIFEGNSKLILKALVAYCQLSKK